MKLNSIKLSILLLIMSLLTGCLGPELFTVGVFKVKAGTAATIPHKIETYEKYKEKKEYKEKEHKKRFELNKLEERTFEIYY
jgi:hypothetical protein